MTGEEISKRYMVPMEILREYESWDLCGAGKPGHREYDDRDLEWIGLVLTLYSVGFSPEETEFYMRLELGGAETGRQRIQMLEGRRKAALDELHRAEQQIRSLDCLRHEIAGDESGPEFRT